jgi:hypothetical protein
MELKQVVDDVAEQWKIAAIRSKKQGVRRPQAKALKTPCRQFASVLGKIYDGHDHGTGREA